MNIIWHGLSCVKIQGKSVSLLVNPFDPSKIGLTCPKSSFDIVVDTKKIYPTSKSEFVVNRSGEYEIKGVFIYSILTENEKKAVSRITVDDISIANLGDMKKGLTAEDLKLVEGVDVLILPVGGEEVLDAKKSVEVINAIEPKIVIPVYFHVTGSNVKLDGVNGFLKEFGQSGLVSEDKAKITKKALPVDETKIILLNKS